MNIHLSDCLLCNATHTLCVIRVMCSAAKELSIWQGACNKGARRHATEEGINYLQRKSIWVQHECNKQVQFVPMWHSHTHTHIHVCQYVTHPHTQAHIHSLTACTVCASCAVFNFLWPTETITINITQTRHALCPRTALPPSASSPHSTLLWYAVPPGCSLSRMKNAIRIDIDANEKCQLFSRVGKENQLYAHSKQFEHEYEYECEYECYTWQKNRERNRQREREREREDYRAKADVVNFELIQLQFLQPHLTFVCSSLNEPEIEVASSNKSAKYSQNIKNSSRKIK